MPQAVANPFREATPALYQGGQRRGDNSSAFSLASPPNIALFSLGCPVAQVESAAISMNLCFFAASAG
jgi:hypothetical protein